MIDVVKNISRSKKFTSIKETYEEIRSMYFYEQNRFQAIENKVTSFLSMNSFLAFIFSIVIISGYYIFIPVIIFVLLSVYYSFKVLDLKEGRRPGRVYDDYYQYAKMGYQRIYDAFLLAYIESVKIEEENNKKKVENLNLVIRYSKFAWFSLVIGVLYILISTLAC